MDKYIRLSLPAIISLLHERHYTNPMIGKTIGVTSLQVHYYHKGKTKAPKAEVCMKLFKEFTFDGERLLVDLYKDFDELEHHHTISKV